MYCRLLICLVVLLSAATLAFAKPAAANSGVFNLCNNNTSSTTSLTSIQSSTICKNSAAAVNSSKNPVITTIKDAIEIVSFIIGVAAVVTIIVAGLRMILSGGNSENINGARSATIYAVIGLFVAIMAQILVVFVLDRIK